MDDSFYLFWNGTIFWIALPALLVVSLTILRQLWNKAGLFPTYWVCAHVAGFGILATMAFTGGRGLRSSLLVLCLVAILCWAAVMKFGLDWWKARRAKHEPPD